MGSTRLARRAGAYPATAAIPNSKSMAAEIATGSPGATMRWSGVRARSASVSPWDRQVYHSLRGVAQIFVPGIAGNPDDFVFIRDSLAGKIDLSANRAHFAKIEACGGVVEDCDSERVR